MQHRIKQQCATSSSSHSAKALSIGIDLGTSTSCCAVYRNGAPELVPRRVDGKLLTPSVCVVSSDSIRLDEPDTALNDNEVLVTSWKRAIGLDKATAAWRVEEPPKKDYAWMMVPRTPTTTSAS